jgi:hypothetical protein
MDKNRRYYFLFIYSALLVAACAGFFSDGKLFIIAASAAFGVGCMWVMEKIYHLLLTGSLRIEPKATPPLLLIALAFVALVCTVFLYFSSTDAGMAGCMLAVAIYCLHTLARTGRAQKRAPRRP